MKKKEMKVYESPQMEIVEFKAKFTLLAGSTGETENLDEEYMP